MIKIIEKIKNWKDKYDLNIHIRKVRRKKIKTNLIDFFESSLEEILIILGFIFFVYFGFMIANKIGVLFISISLFSLAYLSLKKKIMYAKGGVK